MNILITGANGFIGQHLGKHLSEKCNIFGLARGLKSNSNLANVKLVLANLADPKFVQSLPDNINCIIHLAQSREYRKFPDGAEDMRIVNVDSTCRLLEWARQKRVNHFIFASTANVYGKSREPLTESSITKPDSYYGASKLAAEHLARQYQQYFQVDILRLFTVYGPGQKEMLVPNIAERIKSGRTVTLAGGIGLYLTPIFVGDVVGAIDKLVEESQADTARVFNVCGSKIVKLSEMIKIIENVVGKSACIENTDEEVQWFTGVNTALRECLRPINFMEIEKGLKLTLQLEADTL